MTKGEQRLDSRSLVVAVPNEQAFAVVDLQVLARPVIVSGGVLNALGES